MTPEQQHLLAEVEKLTYRQELLFLALLREAHKQQQAAAKN